MCRPGLSIRGEGNPLLQIRVRRRRRICEAEWWYHNLDLESNIAVWSVTPGKIKRRAKRANVLGVVGQFHRPIPLQYAIYLAAGTSP